jgi:hypothetical protein
MKRISSRRICSGAFELVKQVGLTLPDVQLATRYDGSPVLQVDGVFMAGLATHHSAEPDTLVVRVGFEERALLLQEAPDTYYLTDYHRNNPIVLVRLSRIDRDALRDLLSVSRQLTLEKTPKFSGSRRRQRPLRLPPPRRSQRPR